MATSSAMHVLMATSIVVLTVDMFYLARICGVSCFEYCCTRKTAGRRLGAQHNGEPGSPAAAAVSPSGRGSWSTCEEPIDGVGGVGRATWLNLAARKEWAVVVVGSKLPCINKHHRQRKLWLDSAGSLGSAPRVRGIPIGKTCRSSVTRSRTVRES